MEIWRQGRALLLAISALSCAGPRADPIPARRSTEGASKAPADLDPSVIFTQILEKHRVRAERHRSPGQCHSDHPTRQMRELGFHLTEARLWAVSYPKEAERRAFPLALDRTSNPDDRSLAIEVVGVLASLGNPRAEPLLCSIIRSDSDPAAASATWVLSKGDPEGRYRELYWRRARRGDDAALDVLGEWVDAGTKQVLEEISRDASRERDAAWRSLRRILQLEAPNWALRITSHLESSRGDSFREFNWALRVARNRSLPGLHEILRKRLDLAEDEHWKLCVAIYEDFEGCVAGQVYERDFTGSFLVATVDWYFDDVLKAYAELGGELTELERQRLHQLGYGNDPRKRLFEFVKDWKQAPQ